ncbi:MAG: histone deacetylase [marine benthic group bacterium]|nr:histone deacetylase [Gemmatimonadota bacterium]
MRPPGHHAEVSESCGFCFFNNLAVAAKYAQEKHKVKKVLILDWDIHHGNGTQDAFFDDESVFYLSMHASPHYPGTGAADERGVGVAEGTTLNLPLPMGLEAERYVAALVEGLETAARFEPQLVLISAGFDAALGDPLGGFTLEPDDFRDLTLAVHSLTSGSAGGRIVSILEGGYDPPALGLNVDAHLRALVEATTGVAPPNDAAAYFTHSPSTGEKKQ